MVLLAPKQTADPTPTPMLALSATEREPPKGEEPLHWLLLTNRRTRAAGRPLVPDPMGQRNLVLRLKTGSRIKDRQLDDAEDLRECLTFDAVTACHVEDPNFMARSAPDTPASQFVGQDAVDCLYNDRYLLRIGRSRGPPGNAPDGRWRCWRADPVLQYLLNSAANPHDPPTPIHYERHS